MSAQPSSAPAQAGQAAEHLTLTLRKDLVIEPVAYEGVTHYVVKDPIALKYFRFKQEEFFLLEQFDGKTNLQDVKRRFEAKYKPQTISVDDLIRFGSQLHEAGLVLVDTPEQGRVLIKRRRKKQLKKVGQFFANILFIKVPLFDPERLLTGMLPWFRWLYSRWFNVFAVSLMLAAITLVATQWSTFYSKLPTFESFFNWYTLLYFWVSLAVVKVIHEFGHGLTAKYYGSEVHEMGALLLVLTPALYCDVTDSWLLKNKWHRIWIAAAGIYVECFLAAIATFVWWNTQPGVLNSLMMSVMFICSVNTILFNANPLLRYDGYYVMSDWLEIPNLRIKSTQFFAYLIQDKVLGLEIPVQSYMPRSRRSLFVFYAVASYLYRWVVSFGIIFFLYSMLKPYGLQSISAALAIGSMVPLVVIPLYKIIKFVRTPGRLRKMKKARAAAWALGAVAVVTLVLLIPTPLTVQGPLVLTAADPNEIYVEVPGRLASLNVRDGEHVRAGQVIANLSNPEKLRERENLSAEHDIALIRAQAARRENDNSSRALAATYDAQAAKLAESLSEVEHEIAKLNLVAPADGRVIGIPHPEHQGRYGKHLETGLFCEVADPGNLEAHLILDQSDVELIGERSTAWVKIYGHSERTYKWHVTEVSNRNREEIPPELTSIAGGEIAAEPDQKTGKAKPLTAMYEVVIPVDNSDHNLQPGLRGFAKIDGGRATLGWWLYRLVAKTFHFTL